LIVIVVPPASPPFAGVTAPATPVVTAAAIAPDRGHAKHSPGHVISSRCMARASHQGPAVV